MRSPRTRLPKWKARISLEQLEARNLLAYSPAQIAHAYGFDLVNFANGTIKGDGTGQTIAIVDPFDDPTIASDLQHFDQTFGLPDPPSFQKLTPQGLPARNTSWDLEIALDVEWAHAIAPKANIDLVEALNSTTTSLYAADVFAAGQPGVSVVSNSWGGNEYFSETADDKNFVHAGVSFVFASGDSGAPPEYPAASPNVLAVGGTTLRLDGSGNYLGETGWGHGSFSFFFGGSGGGISQVEPKPAFQINVTQSATHRTNPDVAFDADPNTGVFVFDTNNGGFLQVGGTSIGAPSWSGLIAIVNQGRAVKGTSSLNGGDLLNQIYKVSANDFHDITSGNNGFPAGPGYDLVTGRGSPKANLLVPDLVATVAGSPAPTPTPGPTPPPVFPPPPFPTPPFPPFPPFPPPPFPPFPPPGFPPRPVPPGPVSPGLVVAAIANADNGALSNAAFFSRTATLPAPLVQTQPVNVSAAAFSATSQASVVTGGFRSAFLGGGSDRLTGDFDGAEPLSVMPASYPEENQRPDNPLTPTDDSTPLVPMSRKAVDSFFAASLPATEVTEGAVPAPIPSETGALPAAEPNAGALGFVAFLGGLWTVRVAREEEKRPAMRR
jgi:hypothetical protein